MFWGEESRTIIYGWSIDACITSYEFVHSVNTLQYQAKKSSRADQNYQPYENRYTRQK